MTALRYVILKRRETNPTAHRHVSENTDSSYSVFCMGCDCERQNPTLAGCGLWVARPGFHSQYRRATVVWGKSQKTQTQSSGQDEDLSSDYCELYRQKKSSQHVRQN
jgi:hypothetical protein